MDTTSYYNNNNTNTNDHTIKIKKKAKHNDLSVKYLVSGGRGGGGVEGPAGSGPTTPPSVSGPLAATVNTATASRPPPPHCDHLGAKTTTVSGSRLGRGRLGLDAAKAAKYKEKQQSRTGSERREDDREKKMKHIQK